MLIQKLDIKSKNNPSKSKLNKSNSTSNVFSVNNLNNLNDKYNLPFLPNDTKIKNDSIQLSHINSFDMRNFLPNKNATLDLMIKYQPKRFIVSKQKRTPNKEIKDTFQDLRNMPLNENKVFNPIISNKDNNIKSTNIIKFSDKKSDEFFDEDFLRLKNFNFRYNVLLNLEKNIKEFISLKNNRNLISNSRLGTYDEIIYKITKIMNTQKNIFEQNLMLLETFDENNKNEKGTIPKKNFENFIKKDVMTFCDYNSLMNKLIEILYEEVHSGKDSNFKLLQKNHEEEIIINAKNKSLNELNSYINRYDVDTKINYVKNQEIKRKQIKELYISKQNEYISKIYQLEKEIKIMANILNKNKIYFNKCKEYEEKIDSSKKEIDQMKRFFRREMREKNSLYEEEVTKKEELKEELTSIKKVVDNLKKEKKHNKNSDLVSKRTINKLENIINEKNENIMMINEELESFLRQNYLLKKKVKDKEFTIVTLEMKIKKDKEKENILNNSNSNNSNIIPINNLEEGQQQ